MQYNYSFEAASLLFMLLIFVHFMVVWQFPTEKTRVFRALLIVCFGESAFNILSSIGLANAGVVPQIVNEILAFVFFSFEGLSSLMIYKYMVVISELEQRQKKRAVSAAMIPAAFFFIFLLLTPFIGFYYYFQDIYAVLEEICRNGVEKVPRGLPLPDMMKTTFEVLSGYALLYPRVMRQVAINVGVEGSERYFGEAFDALFTESMVLAAGEGNFPPELPSFLRHAFLGIFIEWMREEKRMPPEKAAAALEEIGKVVLAGLTGGAGHTSE